MSHTWEWVTTHMNQTCHTYAWVVAHLWPESWHICGQHIKTLSLTATHAHTLFIDCRLPPSLSLSLSLSPPLLHIDLLKTWPASSMYFWNSSTLVVGADWAVWWFSYEINQMKNQFLICTHYKYIYLYTYIFAYLCIHVYVYIFIYIHIYVYTFMYIHMYIK